MTSGIKTTEFWLSLLAVILGALATGGLFDSPEVPGWIAKVVGLAVSILATLGYTASRGIVKSTDIKAEALKASSKENP
jgi:membrane protein implicated in regulation of membrane protease activity